MNWMHVSLVGWGLLGALLRALWGWWKALKQGESFDGQKFGWALARGGMVGIAVMIQAIVSEQFPNDPKLVFESLFFGSLVNDWSGENVRKVLAGMTKEQWAKLIDFLTRR